MTSESINDEKRAKLEERLRLMLKKAETTTPAEAEMIMGRVEKLMLQLGIDDIMKVADGGRNDAIEEESIAFDGVYAKAWVTLAHLIVIALGNIEDIAMDNYKYTANGHLKKSGLKLVIMGYRSDIDRAKMLIESLCLQCVTSVSTHMTKYNETHSGIATPSTKYNAKRSFIVGFGRGASDRIERTRTEVVNEATQSMPGTALVLADRGTIVRRAYEEKYTHRTKTRGMRVTNSYDDGVRAGRQARTGETEVSGRSRKAIG